MANLASALKDEISRIARKEIRQQTTGATKSVAKCEREIAALKRQIEDLRRKLSSSPAKAAPKAGTSTKAPSAKAPSSQAPSTKARATKTPASKTAPKDKSGKAAVATPAPASAPAPAKKAAPAKKTGRARFSAKGLKTNRERLGLSADNYGKLVGVSGLSIYNWEQGKARPRESSIEALLKIRGIGKREAAQRLEAMQTEASTAKKGAGSGEERSKGAS